MQNKIKINSGLFYILLISFSLTQENTFPIKEFVGSGRLEAMVKNHNEKINLVQIDAINDSLVNRVLSGLPDLELYGGPASYHRLLHDSDLDILEAIITKEFYEIIDSDYHSPNSRDYWALTLQGNQYNSTSGETNNSCMCLDASDCVVVGYNDSWYNPLDYYGEVSWSFSPPDYDDILEVRMYVAGAQCDALPVWSETTLSVKNNECSWSDFQATLSLDYVVNGPYVITDDLINQIWCEGSLQPVIGSEDNYNVNWVQVEIYYTCELEDPPENFSASNEEFCDYVSIDWINDTNVDGYSLYRDGEFVMNFSSDENQFIDYFAQNDIEHQYCLTVLNECGESNSACDMGSRQSSPQQTENVLASDEFVNYILTVWDESIDTEYYNLYRDGSLLSVIPSQGELLYQDVFVEQGLVYEYCIESVNECGGSSWTCASGTTAVGLIGDINLDQVIDVLDIVILLNFVLEITTPTSDEIWSSDINQDQILNVLDIVGLVNIILR